MSNNMINSNLSHPPDLTLSIVTGGNRDQIIGFLRSVKQWTSSISYEIILMEYKKSDDTEEVVRREVPEAIILLAPHVRGYAENHNDVLKQSKGRYLAVLNDDMVLENDALGIMVRYLDEHLDVGVIGAQLLNRDGTIQPSSYVSFSTPKSELKRFLRLDALTGKGLTGGYPFMTIFGRCSGNHHKTHETAHIMGACMVFRREVFFGASGFDKQFFMGYEDQDICRRIGLSGHKVVYLPMASITHLGSQTVGKLGFGMSMHMFGSRLYFHDKWNGKMGAFLARVFIAGQLMQVLAASPFLYLIPGKKAKAGVEWRRAVQSLKKVFSRRTDK